MEERSQKPELVADFHRFATSLVLKVKG